MLRAPRKLCRFSYVFFVFFLFYVLDVVSITVYDRDTLLNIGSSVAQCKPDFEFLNAGGLFTDTAPEPFVWNARPRRKKRSRKRGKRAGVLVRLRRCAFRPPLPTILLANVQSLDNKLCELRARISYQRETRECCVICLTETWMSAMVPDSAIELTGFSVHRSDRTKELTGKSRGGGVCFYINNSWCDERNLHSIKSFCSPDLEFHMLLCRPFWLPREFTAIIITAVYIPPQANTDQALRELYGNISEQETAYPEAAFVITGDFNKANFRTIAPKYFQHITINTRGDRVLDHCYSPFRDAYKSLPRPPFGKSDHSSVLLLPALNPETLTIGNKPVTISGDPSKQPNDNIKTKLKNNSTTTTQEACGRGINNITGFKGNKPATVNIAASLPDELNTFYACFEAHNTAHTECAPTAAAEEVSPLSLSVADVTRSFKRVNICKAVGPDGIPGRVLKACAYQLAGVFTDIFNLSLSLSVVPSCFKKSTIVPIPKKNKITCLNDWRPVALTPIFSKCFEKLIRDHICSVLPASLDPLQYAYRRNRSTDDAIAFTLHTALSDLETKNTYVRMLLVDYSSAFNTIVPATLVEKLQTLGLNRSLCSWILDFLTGRSQVVRMGNNTSSPLILNTGAPQGCVLSPLLYSLYTHDCTATHSSNVIVKFADDTTVIGLITDNDETAYREEVSTLTKWCQENHLSLNIDKTKELVVDFRRQSREHTPISIDKTPVERVNSFKFLGVHITEDLTWSTHTDAVLKKAHQRLFFLRRLRKFGMSPSILRSFYTCTVESILTGCITAWFGNSTAGNRKALQRVVRTARHIVGGELPSLQDIYTRRCIRKARRIIKDSSHPSHRLLSLLPSGRRLRSIRSRTSRLRDSFFPQAIRLMNSQD